MKKIKYFYNWLFPKKEFCEYCHKSDQIEVNYQDWCKKCHKMIMGKFKRKLRWLK